VLPAPTLVASHFAVPSVTSVLASACPRAWRLQYAAGVMSCTSLPLPMWLPNASVSAVAAHAVTSIVGSAKSGRLGVVGLFKRFPSVARRPASADSYPTASACHLGSFVFQPRGFNASVALSPFSPLRGPTRRSRGRCAMKPRSAPELKRWTSQ
jgi:hypothetical protein